MLKRILQFSDPNHNLKVQHYRLECGPGAVQYAVLSL